MSQFALRFDIPVMLAVAVACLPVFFTGHLIARWEGGLFLGDYCAYTGYLALAATASPLSGVFAVGMLGNVIPPVRCAGSVSRFRFDTTEFGTVFAHCW